MCVAENILPRIVLRLVQHLRVNTVLTAMQLSNAAALEKYEKAIEEADRFLKLLHDFSSLGAAMRTVLTKVLVDKEVRAAYKSSLEPLPGMTPLIAPFL